MLKRCAKVVCSRDMLNYYFSLIHYVNLVHFKIGDILGQFGDILGRSGDILRRYGDILGRSGDILG